MPEIGALARGIARTRTSVHRRSTLFIALNCSDHLGSVLWDMNSTFSGLELALPSAVESGAALEGFPGPCLAEFWFGPALSFLLSRSSQWSLQLGPHLSLRRLELLCDIISLRTLCDILLGPEPLLSGPRTPTPTYTPYNPIT